MFSQSEYPKKLNSKNSSTLEADGSVEAFSIALLSSILYLILMKKDEQMKIDYIFNYEKLQLKYILFVCQEKL